MLGTILNGLAVLVGGVIGLVVSRPIAPAHQQALKVLLGVFTVYVGLSTTWRSLHGTFLQGAGQVGIVVLALMLGNVTGKLLRLQAGLNRLGRFAKAQIESTRPGSRTPVGEAMVTGAILFCLAPLAFLGPLLDGLNGDWRALGIKAVMDGLATLAFVTLLGRGFLLSVVPLVAWQGTLALAARTLEPFLTTHLLTDAVQATAGLLVFSVSLIIFGLRRVELTDYLPGLIYAPLLTILFR